MIVEVINVGTELLVGNTLNTHQHYLAGQCAELGIDLYRMHVVGDNRERIAETVQSALMRSDMVITTGGLGPTEDDITLEATANSLGCELVVHSRTHKAIAKRCKQYKVPFSFDQKRQSWVPKNSHIFHNHHGTAPGILLRHSLSKKTKYILLLPGPPRELFPMFERQVKPKLLSLMTKRSHAFVKQSLHFPGQLESIVSQKIKQFLKSRPPVTMGIYAHLGSVELTIMSRAKNHRLAMAAAEKLAQNIRGRFKNTLILEDNETLEEELLKHFKKQKQTLSVAESCTGGAIHSLLTRVPGASKSLRGGLIAYHNDIKVQALGVSLGALKRYGAVSSIVANQMALGIQKMLNTDYAIATTGIAGPTGATKNKPVGLVWFSIAGPNKKAVAYQRRFTGDREAVQAKSSKIALTLLLRTIRGFDPI